MKPLTPTELLKELRRVVAEADEAREVDLFLLSSSADRATLSGARSRLKVVNRRRRAMRQLEALVHKDQLQTHQAQMARDLRNG